MSGLGDTNGFPAGHEGDWQEPQDGEVVERHRAVDAELVTVLAQQGFSGPVYEKFELTLCEYGRPILLAWLRTGEIFTQCRRRNLRFSGPPRPFTSDDRVQLADHTLAAALPAFRRRSLVEGGWNPSGKAALTTYFVNSLPIHFSNAYRSWCRQARKEIAWQGRTKPDSDFTDIPDTRVTSDPLQLYLLRETVQEELKGLNATTRSVLIMLYEGYKYAEIAEIHGLSARAIEARVQRHRQRMRRRPGNEFG